MLIIVPIMQALAPNLTWVAGGSLGLSLTTLFMDMFILLNFFASFSNYFLFISPLNLLLPIV